MKTTKIIIDPETLKTYLRTHTFEETGAHFGVCVNTIVRRCREYNLTRITIREVTTLTDHQHKVLIGSLLGDGFVPHTKHAHHNHHFRIRQKHEHWDYLVYLSEILSPLALPLTTEMMQCREKRLPVSLLRTRCHPVFNELRSRWYLNGKKIVPMNLELSPEAVAHWFVQDGHNNRARTYASLATHCFTLDEVELLRDKMKDAFGLHASIWKASGHHQLAFYKDCYEPFLDVIRPWLVWNSFQYKVA